MSTIAAMVHAVIALHEAQRAQLEALLMAVMDQQPPPAQPTGSSGSASIETCPSCGASGETQQAARMMSGKTHVFCQSCKTSRVVGGPQTE